MTATFYLGTHMPNWLDETDVPLFVSRRRLFKRKTLPKARGPWALDSGGFTELAKFGGWSVTAEQYAAEVREFYFRIGRMEWAAPQDWMCEPTMLANTGKTVAEHIDLTVRNFLALRRIAPDLPFVPVVQGWKTDDYYQCVELYRSYHVDLAEFPVVGVGSVCRRGQEAEIGRIIRALSDLGIRCHGFGVRSEAFQQLSNVLKSADSMAWSYNARLNPRYPGCTHKTCANCLKYALRWRERLLAGVHPELELTA